MFVLPFQRKFYAGALERNQQQQQQLLQLMPHRTKVYVVVNVKGTRPRHRILITASCQKYRLMKPHHRRLVTTTIAKLP